jgi:hypothetical protein
MEKQKYNSIKKIFKFFNKNGKVDNGQLSETIHWKTYEKTYD